MELIHANMAINLHNLFIQANQDNRSKYHTMQTNHESSQSVFFFPVYVCVWKKASIVKYEKEDNPLFLELIIDTPKWLIHSNARNK